MRQLPYFYKGIKTCILVSEDGTVYYEPDKVYLTPYRNTAGYLYIHKMLPDRRDLRRAVHQMVAETFIPNPENKPYVNHIDGNKQNNHVNNLEWCTPSENNIHAYQHGLKQPTKSSECHFAKYSEYQVHMACKEIEKNKLSLRKISALTGIPHKSLCEIRSGKIWKSISSQYTFPRKTRECKTNDFTPDQKILMEDLVLKGIPVDDICDKVGIDHSRKSKMAIYSLRYRLFLTEEGRNQERLKRQTRRKNKLTKLEKKILRDMDNVQRLSKAYDEYEWEEELIPCSSRSE